MEQVLILGPEKLPIEASELPDSRQIDRVKNGGNAFQENLIKDRGRDLLDFGFTSSTPIVQNNRTKLHELNAPFKGCFFN